jgi:hypothetical protein
MIRIDFRMLVRKSLELIFRFQLQPSLGSIANRVSYQSVDGDALLHTIFPETDLGPLEHESQSLHSASARDPSGGGSHPSVFYAPSAGMEDGHVDLLYKAVRIARPSRVVETGVADGRSSRALLRAMSVNGSGRLTSVDVAGDVGAMIEPALRDRWDLVVLPATGRKEAVVRCLRSQAPLDIFIHDSDHSYGWQSFEYRAAYEALRPGGLLISDDIDASFAFLDFVSRVGSPSLACVGSRKVMGVVIKTPVPPPNPAGSGFPPARRPAATSGPDARSAPRGRLL